MNNPQTLLELSGANLQPASLQDATLVIIDMQNEYLDGPLKLPHADRAVEVAQMLLSSAREAGKSDCPCISSWSRRWII